MRTEELLTEVQTHLAKCDRVTLAPEVLHIGVIMHGTRVLATMAVSDSVKVSTFDKCLTVLKRNYLDVTMGLSENILERGVIPDELIYSLGNLSEHVVSLAKSVINKNQFEHAHVNTVLANLEQRRKLLLGLVQATLEE